MENICNTYPGNLKSEDHQVYHQSNNHGLRRWE